MLKCLVLVFQIGCVCVRRELLEISARRNLSFFAHNNFFFFRPEHTCAFPVCGTCRSQTDRQTDDRQTHRQTQTDRQTDRQADRQTDRQTDKQKAVIDFSTFCFPTGWASRTASNGQLCECRATFFTYFLFFPRRFRRGAA